MVLLCRDMAFIRKTSSFFRCVTMRWQRRSAALLDGAQAKTQEFGMQHRTCSEQFSEHLKTSIVRHKALENRIATSFEGFCQHKNSIRELY